MSLTLNQVVKSLNSIAVNHPQINHFFFGEEWDFASSGVVNCPAMIVVLEPTNVERAYISYNLKIYIGDLVQKDLSNKTEVLSDTMLIALDVIAILKSPAYNWTFDGSSTLSDFEDSFDCELYGHWFNIKLKVAAPSDRCSIPNSQMIDLIAEETPVPILFCNKVDDCLGISENGSATKFLNEKGDWVIVSGGGLSCETLADCQTIININASLGNKVDKVTGKGLSTEDYTTTEKNKLASITEIFTTALKNAYDGAVSWISTNGTNLLNHLSNTSNPHSVTASQVGAVAVNASISGATKTKITYDSKGLVTSGADATTSDIADSASYRYVTDVQILAWNAMIGGSIFQSVWNATTNTPALVSGIGTKGYYYIVSVAGTTNLNSITDWNIGDWAIFDGTVWRKVDNTTYFPNPTGTTAQYLRGDGSLATFPSIPSVGTWGALNYPTWVSGTPFVKMSASGTFSLDTNTYLTSVGAGTTNEITYWSGTNTIGSLTTATYPSLTELSYVKGVTSAIQTQLGNKASASAESSQSRLLSAATGLTTNVVANVTATALTLAAGTWDISAMIGFGVGTLTNITNQGVGGISITSATLPTTDATAVPNANGEVRCKLPSTNAGIVFGTGTTYVMSIPQYRVMLSVSTTFYLVAQATFTVSTLSVFGSIRAIPVI